MKNHFFAFCVALTWIDHSAFAQDIDSENVAINVVYTPPAYASNGLYLVEGCLGGELALSRPNGLTGSLNLQFVCSGSAMNGEDVLSVPVTFIMPTGQDLLVLPIDALTDDATEVSEEFIISVSCNEVSAFQFQMALEIKDATPMTISHSPVEIYCDQDALLQLDIAGGSGMHAVEWSTQEVGNPYLVTDPMPGNMTYTVTDVCNAIPVATGAVMISFIPYPAIQLDAGPDLTVNCTQDIAIQINPTGGNGDYSYQWYVNGNPSNSNTDASFLWTGPVTSEVSVIVTDACNNAGVDQLQVTLYNTPPVIAIGDDLQGNCLEMKTVNAVVTGGLGSSDVNWYYNNEWIGLGNSIAFPVDTGGVLWAQAEDGCGSIGNDELIVAQSPIAINVSINPIFGMCQDELPVSAEVSGGVGDTYNYQWVFQGALVSAEPTAAVLALPNQLVQLTITDVCGNVAVALAPIVLDVQDIEVDATEQLIASNCSQLWSIDIPTVSGGTGNYNYQWHVSGQQEGLANTAAFDLDVTGLDHAWLIINVTDECTNLGTDSTLILISLPEIVTNVNAELSFGCLEPIVIGPEVAGGNGAYTFQWIANNDTISTSQILNTPALVSQTILLVVTDGCGLYDETPIQIAVQPTQLSAQIVADDETICPNQELSLMVDLSNTFGDIAIAWSSGQQDTETISLIASDNQIIICNVSDACGNSAQASYALAMLQSEGEFIVRDDFMLCHNHESGALATGGYIPYEYEFASNVIAPSANGIVSIGTAEVLVTVSDACGQTGHVRIDSRSCDFIVPNVITPNNDSKNDTFEINGLEKYPNSTLVVFNRNGEKVFESDSYKNDWSAEGLPEGTYFMVLHRNDGEQFEGSIAVIR
jgi:gliding motility-associated-like protein